MIDKENNGIPNKIRGIIKEKLSPGHFQATGITSTERTPQIRAMFASLSWSEKSGKMNPKTIRNSPYRSMVRGIRSNNSKRLLWSAKYQKAIIEKSAPKISLIHLYIIKIKRLD